MVRASEWMKTERCATRYVANSTKASSDEPLLDEKNQVNDPFRAKFNKS